MLFRTKWIDVTINQERRTLERQLEGSVSTERNRYVNEVGANHITTLKKPVERSPQGQVKANYLARPPAELKSELSGKKKKARGCISLNPPCLQTNPLKIRPAVSSLFPRKGKRVRFIKKFWCLEKSPKAYPVLTSVDSKRGIVTVTHPLVYGNRFQCRTKAVETSSLVLLSCITFNGQTRTERKECDEDSFIPDILQPSFPCPIFARSKFADCIRCVAVSAVCYCAEVPACVTNRVTF